MGQHWILGPYQIKTNLKSCLKRHDQSRPKEENRGTSIRSQNNPVCSTFATWHLFPSLSLSLSSLCFLLKQAGRDPSLSISLSLKPCIFLCKTELLCFLLCLISSFWVKTRLCSNAYIRWIFDFLGSPRSEILSLLFFPSLYLFVSLSLEYLSFLSVITYIPYPKRQEIKALFVKIWNPLCLAHFLVSLSCLALLGLKRIDSTKCMLHLVIQSSVFSFCECFWIHKSHCGSPCLGGFLWFGFLWIFELGFWVFLIYVKDINFIDYFPHWVVFDLVFLIWRSGLLYIFCIGFWLSLNTIDVGFVWFEDLGYFYLALVIGILSCAPIDIGLVTRKIYQLEKCVVK